MTASRKPTTRRLSQEEIARRGRRLYEEQIRDRISDEAPGRVVAIDVQSGDYAVGDDSLTAAAQIRERLEGAQIFFLRIGHQALHRFGPRLAASS